MPIGNNFNGLQAAELLALNNERALGLTETDLEQPLIGDNQGIPSTTLVTRLAPPVIDDSTLRFSRTADEITQELAEIAAQAADNRAEAALRVIAPEGVEPTDHLAKRPWRRRAIAAAIGLISVAAGVGAAYAFVNYGSGNAPASGEETPEMPGSATLASLLP